MFSNQYRKSSLKQTRIQILCCFFHLAGNNKFTTSGSKVKSSSHDLFCPLRLFSYLLDKGVEPKQRQVTWIMYVSCLIPAASVGTLVGDIGGGIGETVSSRESMLVMPCKFTDPYFSPILSSNGSSNPIFCIKSQNAQPYHSLPYRSAHYPNNCITMPVAYVLGDLI